MNEAGGASVQPNLNPFRDLIKDKCGLTFDGSRDASLQEGIKSRIAQSGTKSYDTYYRTLLTDEEEFQNLVSLLTVNETYFFREHDHLALLSEKIFPGMLGSRKQGDIIKIVSAGCSTGEEPFSIVMEFFEKFGPTIRDSIAVSGFDIDREALSTAERGVFNTHSFRGFPHELREKYFESLSSGRFALCPPVRDCVTFFNMNLVSGEIPPSLLGADIIFYRNVSIYFDADTQAAIFKRLAGMLRDDGYLIVSSTETLSHNIGVLSLLEMDGLFLYQKRTGFPVVERRKNSGLLPTNDAGRKLGTTSYHFNAHKKHTRPAHTAVAPVGPSVTAERRDPHSEFDKALNLARTKKYEEALFLLDGLLKSDGSFIKAYLLKANILLNLKKMKEAAVACSLSIEKDRWCLEGYLMLGLIARIENKNEDALKRFREALYVQSSCWLAHFYLGDIYRSMQNTEDACREYEIVIRLLSKGNLADPAYTFFPLAVPVEQMVHLCKHNLAELRRQKV